jgi:hypothetical protein
VLGTAKRLLVLTTVALLAGASAVSAAFALGWVTGKYAGRTGQKQSITFNAGARSVKYLRVRYKGTCTDGGASNGNQGPLTARIRSGRFSFNGVSSSGATKFHVDGRLAGRRATGTLHGTSRFDADGRPDPNGTTVCSTGTVHWSARHV